MNVIEFKKDFGEKLRLLRKKNGLTQIELSAKLDCTNTSVSNWEKGVVMPDPSSLAAICEYFGLELVLQEAKKDPNRDGEIDDLL